MQYFQVSLANLQTTYLDYVVLYSPLASQQQTMEIWQAMEKLVISDGVKRLGISNCYDLDSLTKLYHASEIKPAIIHNRFYANTGYDRAIRDFCLDE